MGRRETIVYLLRDCATINTLVPLALMQFAISPSILVTLSCQLDTSYSDSKESSLRDRPSHIVSWACLWSILLIANRCRRAQTTVSRTIPNQVVLGNIIKVAETRVIQKTKLLHGSCLGFWFGPCPDFPQCWIVTWKYKPNKPLLFKFAVHWSVLSQHRKETNIVIIDRLVGHPQNKAFCTHCY